MSIHVEGISKFYGEQKALDSVSFKLNKGEIVGFLGPNGAGKSTLMKILTGYLTASEGKAEVNGISLEDDLHKIQQQIGYLPEHNPLYTEMYVREYLEFNSRIYKRFCFKFIVCCQMGYGIYFYNLFISESKALLRWYFR